MPKFNVGDIIEYKNEYEKIHIVSKVIAINIGDNYYTLETLESNLNGRIIGTIRNYLIAVVNVLYKLHSFPKKIISDCTCSSRDLLHKGCQCGYSKALNSQWGLAGLMIKR